MRLTKILLAGAALVIASACGAYAEEASPPAETVAAEEGSIFTFWPLIDYRESKRERYRNISLLGPLIKIQQRGDERETALRPLFYRTADLREKSSNTEYLYPLASVESGPEVETFQFLKLLQKSFYAKADGTEERSSMLFPFYISGRSEKYGEYLSVFPFYGDIYERFWRDEYHYVMFPLYGRTVKKGTTNYNVLYPFFSVTSGERESGFQFWPLYGQSAKEGVYRKKFLVWPLYMAEESGLDTDNPASKLLLFPLYASTESPQRSSRHFLWPFFGHTEDRAKKQEEWDIFWPFWVVERGDVRTVDRWLPFYSEEKGRETLRRWVLWPLYRRDEINSPKFHQERDRLLYFLFWDKRESWPEDGVSRRRTALWPLFLYNRDERGVSALSIPAPVEPVLDREQIDRIWAPFWRLYLQRWNEQGDSALSILWNLYWHERRGQELAFELFPLISYQNRHAGAEWKILKGLVGFRSEGNLSRLQLLWLPFGINWGEKSGQPVAAGSGL